MLLQCGTHSDHALPQRRAMSRAVLALAVLVFALTACEGQKQAIQETLPAAHADRARGDAQAIADAVKIYSVTFGKLPDSLDALTTASTIDGVTGGPFLRALPAPQAGWSPYQYEKRDDGTFVITAAGGGVSVSAP